MNKVSTGQYGRVKGHIAHVAYVFGIQFQGNHIYTFYQYFEFGCADVITLYVAILCTLKK